MEIKLINFAAFYGNENSPSLTPPELGAAFARSSRTLDSLEEILEKTSHVRGPEKADAIFKNVDYGHRSILDMVIVPISLEGISMYSAARLLQFAKQCGAQEASTRYNAKGFVLADLFGGEGTTFTADTPALEEYRKTAQAALDEWKRQAGEIPESATRQERNEILDKIRYTLPAATATTVRMVMSVTGWVNTLVKFSSHSESSPVFHNEVARITKEIKGLIKAHCGEYAGKHIKFDNFSNEKHEFSQARVYDLYYQGDVSEDIPVAVSSLTKNLIKEKFFSKRRTSRYSEYPFELDTQIVEFAVLARFAEVRDLNRHRNYISMDWDFVEVDEEIFTLGTPCVFHYVATLSQVLYMVEIRTSEGAHPAYRKIMNEVLRQIYELYPGLEEYLGQIGFYANQGIVEND